MRIISNFHDYYDGVQNIGGHDTSIIYQRISKDIYKEAWGTTNIFDEVRHPPVSCHEGFFLFLCGEFHYCSEYGSCDCTNYTYKWDDIETITQKVKEEADQGVRRLKKHSNLKARLSKFLAQYDRDFLPVNKFFGSPIVILYRHHRWYSKVVVNPELKRLKFPMDAYTIFQKIEQFVDTHLITRAVPSDIPEKYRFEMKGFDSKTSFRGK